ncbi:hypothetical protein QJS10_CPA01g02324 [Acorus calamus]|uniref:Uncharacterized protein n=1 Tax=Acorus calamus TaxID=4465 RepID=A0AAV9FT50_ACOCL|nr:hypothetical protein QJS10_CPA01g02324 [Acorus calamus]
MAIFERFLRPRSQHPLDSVGRGPSDLEAQRRQHLHNQGRAFAGKLDFPSPKMSVYAKGVSVLMPGHDIPTFIAHPVPPPCPPERVSWPHHQPIRIDESTSNPSTGVALRIHRCIISVVAGTSFFLLPVEREGSILAKMGPCMGTVRTTTPISPDKTERFHFMVGES